MSCAGGRKAKRGVLAVTLIQSIEEMTPDMCFTQACQAAIGKMKQSLQQRDALLQFPVLSFTMDKKFCLGKKFPPLVTRDNINIDWNISPKDQMPYQLRTPPKVLMFYHTEEREEMDTVVSYFTRRDFECIAEVNLTAPDMISTIEGVSSTENLSGLVAFVSPRSAQHLLETFGDDYLSEVTGAMAMPSHNSTHPVPLVS